MKDAIRSEWIKFRTVRANVVLIVIALGVPLALAALVASVATFEDTEARTVFAATVVSPAAVAAFLSGVLGVLGIGQEYRHNTIRVTFAAQPRRSVVLGAKTIVYGLFGAGLGAGSALLNLAVTSPILSGRHIHSHIVPEALVGLALYCALMTLFGFGLGGLMRQPAGAIPVFLVFPLVVEPILFGILSFAVSDRAVRWLPFQSGQRLAATTPDSIYFGRVASGGYFAAWTLLFVALGWWMVERRDA